MERSRRASKQLTITQLILIHNHRTRLLSHRLLLYSNEKLFFFCYCRKNCRDMMLSCSKKLKVFFSLKFLSSFHLTELLIEAARARDEDDLENNKSRYLIILLAVYWPQRETRLPRKNHYRASSHNFCRCYASSAAAHSISQPSLLLFVNRLSTSCASVSIYDESLGCRTNKFIHCLSLLFSEYCCFARDINYGQ